MKKSRTLAIILVGALVAIILGLLFYNSFISVTRSVSTTFQPIPAGKPRPTALSFAVPANWKRILDQQNSDTYIAMYISPDLYDSYPAAVARVQIQPVGNFDPASSFYTSINGAPGFKNIASSTKSISGVQAHVFTYDQFPLDTSTGTSTATSSASSTPSRFVHTQAVFLTKNDYTYSVQIQQIDSNPVYAGAVKKLLNSISIK